jgi:aryl-alcohol dehydrogenase-like predicted oxidoreductase
LIGKWFKLTGRRKEIFLATKFGIIFDPKTGTIDARGDREYVRQCIEGSLKRLGTDYVDLYYQHRIDKILVLKTLYQRWQSLSKKEK